MEANPSQGSRQDDKSQPADDKTRSMKLVGGIPGFYVYEMDGVKVVKCPLDESHVMKESRLQYHLRKCLKSYKGPKVRCPFNAVEYLHPRDFPEHAKHCKAKATSVVHFNDFEQLLHQYPQFNGASAPVQTDIKYPMEEKDYW